MEPMSRSIAHNTRLAVAFVDEIEQRNHVRQRFTTGH